MATLSGEVTVSFNFCLPSLWVSTLKEKNLYFLVLMFSFTDKPLFGRVHGKQTEGCNYGCFPQKKWWKIMQVYELTATETAIFLERKKTPLIAE